MDPVCFARARHDIFVYLLDKVTQVVNEKRSIGQAGYAFLGARSVCKGLVWSAGGKDQETPLQEPQSDERWWPIILVDLPGNFVAVYCPGLAWQNARPWVAHRDRVRLWLDARDDTGSSGSDESPGSASDTGE